MSIGDALAASRCQVGLTVTQVSQRTPIRDPIIRAIENDDYAGCGGDFYARGHIRSIAKAVGADPVPLIREYDATHLAPQEIAAADVLPPTTPTGRHGRRRSQWAVALGLVGALGFVAYYFFSGSDHATSAAPSARAQPVPHRGAGRARLNPAPTTDQAAHPYAHGTIVELTAVRDCWVDFITPQGLYLFRSYLPAGASKSWTFTRAVDMTLGYPGSIRLTVDGKDPMPPGSAAQPITLSLGPNRPATAVVLPRTAVPAHSPAASARPALRTLIPVSATAVGPAGVGRGDNPQLASKAIDRSLTTAWHTDWYTSARFGNLYPGTGLVLDVGRRVAVTGRGSPSAACTAPASSFASAPHARWQTCGPSRTRPTRAGWCACGSPPQRAGVTCSSGSPGCREIGPGPSRQACITSSSKARRNPLAVAVASSSSRQWHLVGALSRGIRPGSAVRPASGCGRRTRTA